MKENLGKILLTVVALVTIVCISVVLSAIAAQNTVTDMFIVWLIFTAEGLKNLLMSKWNSTFCFIGSIFLIVWTIYFIVRIFSTKGALDVDGDEVVSTWSEKKEEIFQKYGHVFWKIGIACWMLSLAMDFMAVGIPTAKQSAVIYVVPKMINNVDMQEIPPNLAELVNEGLKEMIISVKGDVGDVAKEAMQVTKEVAKDTIQETAEKVKEKVGGDGK